MCRPRSTAVLLVTLILNIAPAARSDDSARTVSPSLLINPSLTAEDRGVLGCVEKKSPERLRALLSLELAEKRIQDRFEALQSWMGSKSPATDQEVRTKLEDILREVEGELQPHLTASGKDATLNAYRKVEASRILAETALRLCIAGAVDREAVDRFRAKATEFLKGGYDAISMLQMQKRESEIPSVLARLARTELSAHQLDRMRSTSQESRLQEFDSMGTVIEKYRRLSGSAQEKRELDLVHLESVFSLADSELGSPGGGIVLDDERRNVIETLRREVDAGIRSSKNQRYLNQAEHLRSVSEFYGGDRVSRDEALDRLKAGLNVSDHGKRQRTEKLATDLLHHLGGTVMGRRILENSEKMTDQSSGFREALVKFRQDEVDRSRSYDEGLEHAMGKSAVRKLGLASYEELIRSDGSLKARQQEYVEALSRIGDLQTKRMSNPKSISDGELQSALEAADLHWIYLQCARYQVSGDISAASEPQARVRSPFSNFQVDLEPCMKLRGSSDFHQNAAASEVVEKAVNTRKNRKLMWIAGEFGFDLATVLATGGVSSLVKAPVKAGLRKIGTTMLRHEVAHAQTIKAGVRAAGMVANTFATDLSVQSVKASRKFLESGFKGHWDTSIFSEETVYTQKDGKRARHATRLMATAIANKGLDVLWGRSRLLMPSAIQDIGATKIGSWLGESGKGAVNTQIGSFVGDVATIPFDGCQNLSTTSIFSGERWVESMKDSLLGKIRGSSVTSARYVGATFFDRMTDFDIDSVSPEQMAQLRSCTLPSSGSAAVRSPAPAAERSVKEEGKGP